jgi:HKD family nuclease
MDITFFPHDAHGFARRMLDDVLSKGTDRVMIACAFCSGAGVAIMRRHLQRLSAPGSCLVVSADFPTDVAAVNNLASEVPGRIWVHETGKLPFEKRVGHALMHSKVFYSEAGDKCWLWVGSHNLTARAMTGANLEAAVLLSGHPAELPFQAARKHIEDCRSESSPCPVEVPPLPDGENVDVLVIHAEAAGLPTQTSIFHVRLGLRSPEFDPLLRPVAQARLHLYRTGDLRFGWQNALPWSSYAGTLTGLNFTNLHPVSPGITASWAGDDYSIIDEPPVLHFSRGSPDAEGIVTQAVINIERFGPPDEAFLPSKPKAESVEQTAEQLVGEAGDDLVKFFTKASVRRGHLVYEVRHQGTAAWKLPIGELRESSRLELRDIAESRQIQLFDEPDVTQPHHPLIMRARYVLRKRPPPAQ